MIRHLLILMLRQIQKDKLFMLIRIAGLAVGMAASLLMLLFIYQQNNFDTFHTNKDEIYHLIIENKREGLTDHLAVGTAAMGVSLYEEFPEITGFTRFSMHGEAYFQVGDQVKMLGDIQHADSGLFSMFSFELLRGNPETALKAPFTMVLTESGARQLLGDSDPMGKVLKMNGKHDYLVTGVMKDPPANSHLQFNGLISFSTLYHLDGYYMDWDGGWGYYTYLRMDKNTGPEHLKEKLPAFLEKHINYKYRNYGVEISMKFDKLTDVYLNSAAPEYLFISGNKTNLFIFGIVAVFILLIACINFMNLSTAGFAARSREVGVRKTFGASRTQLIFQFLGESVVISLIALVGAILLTEIFLTDLSELFDTKISLSDFSVWIWVLFIIALALLVGIFSGSYPAFFLSSFRPGQVLKGNFLPGNKGSWFRNALVIGQFLISAALITSTIGVFRQLNFMGKKELGFDRENVMVLELKGERSQQSVEQLKTAINQMPYVLSAGASTNIPVWGLTSNGYIPEGMETSVLLNVVDVDEDWLETMRIELVEGRNFDAAIAKDNENIIVNQTLAEKMDWDDPIGKYLQRDGKHHVIGVVDDFHFSPLHQPIQPLVITTNPFRNFYYLSVRLNTNDYRRAIEDIETIWTELLPAEPFIYKFLDQMLLSTYEKEEKFGKGFTWFALLAVFLACLGLFALSGCLHFPPF